MKELIDFFDFLSWRKYKEPDLSDITWTLCKASEKFKKLFVNFCFNEEIPDMEIEREIPSHDSRPDFYCEDEEQRKWIIEVKIDDKTNLHFEQYRKEFPKAKCAFIANYDAKSFYDDKLNFSITMWKDFVNFIEKNIDETDLLIIGYSKYLKNIIGYLEVKDMNLNKVNSLPDFGTVMNNIISGYSGKELKLNNQIKSITEHKFGRYVYFKNKNGKYIYFWIGIYFSDEKEKFPYLCLEFNIADENRVPKKEANVIKNIKKGEYSLEPDIDHDTVYFYLSDKFHDILFSEKSEIEKQKDIIKNFLDEILKNI